MKKIEIDDDVYKKLGEIAKPFEETTPNMVLRRLLNLPKAQTSTEPQFHHSHPSLIENYIEELRIKTLEIHPAFLTFLMDKYNNSKGNYRTSDIIVFMKKVNLELPNGRYRNPWMKAPYGGQKNGLISCQRTIEHYRQTRKFGCWGGRDIKANCQSFHTCDYHPNSKVKMKNKCDLRNGVIWKRESPSSPFSYGHNYLEVIKKELLKKSSIPLKSLLKIVYFGCDYNTRLIERFKNEFHLNNEEFNTLFTE